MFKRLKLIANEVEKITKDEVLEFHDQFLKKEGPFRKKLSVQIFAKQHMENFKDPVPEDSIQIDDPAEFKRVSSLFGLPLAVDVEEYKL